LNRYRPTVAVYGGANVDIQARCAERYRPADSNPGTASTSLGGVGRNIAENLARLGVATELVTVFGGDETAAMLADGCRAIGIEVVNLARDEGGVFTFPAYPREQVEVLIELLRDILARYPHIGPSDILGHSDVAYWRKSDPGPRLPWRGLFEAGVGAWFDEATRAMYQRRFCVGLPPEVEVERAFQRYGYKPAQNRQAFELRTRAFQMHFRPRDYGGALDAETCAILYALNDKYRGL